MSHELYHKVAVTLPTIGGWCTIKKGYALTSLVLALRPKVIVEVGVYAGKSTFAMALACKELGNGTVVAIDAWSAAVSKQNEIPDHAEWWAAVDHDKIFQQFSAKMIELGLQNVIQVHRKKSDDVTPPEVIDIFSCDGSHTDQAITDVERFASKVRIGGMVILDDTQWVGGGVLRAMDTLLEMGFVELYRVNGTEEHSKLSDDWAVFQRIK